MATKKDVTTYYDKFSQHQETVALNDRHIYLFEKLKTLGLHSGSSVLELGCGIGTITQLLANIIDSGTIEAIDISPESILKAKASVPPTSHIHIEAADILSYTPKRPRFDFITLFDVLEHIPEEHHREIFARIGPLLHQNAYLVINIPHPESIKYDRIHRPEYLQVIDQPISFVDLMNAANDAGLELFHFETLSLWQVDDYQSMIFRSTRPFKDEWVSEKRSVGEKINKKIETIRRKLKYGTK